MSTTKTNIESILQLAHQWWSGLEAQWKQAFNEGVLQLGNIQDVPGDDDLLYLFQDAENIRLAGPRAPHPNLSFELTNLSGIAAMQKLSFLSVTEGALTSVSELAGLQNLTSLFVQNNRLTSLSGIEGNKNLVNLYAQGNAITSLEPIRNLTKIQILSVAGNELESLEGITPAHTDEMRQCLVLPNEKLRDRDILKLQNECQIIARKG
ncbi:leucine-rich repeat domain-containing protein [Neolewinella aurantiaca]|uniref:Leucine-rich repeat domain-containing protein n=1 Tax=Neolewinella aurantiaca TaxID=2602767 RepID=A0A5C7FKI3_9BACT|nr:leucine-rich repeat domain-containing protein [Neolewinella aurantiaca]TXF90466.1 leucine-rich repeat domain-containing protein [Neolewinella aurantiaca]